jgi:hypothetical protein
MPFACTANHLTATASAAGKDSTSGTITLYHAGSQTSITCVLGTGFVCIDNTHSLAFSAGDLFEVGVETSTTNGTDSTANLRVTFACN